ncbi:protein kinase domain-containing protein [Nocardia transvalensis]|uniref:protein kinase domain-containing protein n=1 Tax=Nocardia transvalensis TaxID=37333 RepID=UPI002B4B3902|nr:protein kinase [Nocardia transvalensis]
MYLAQHPRLPRHVAIKLLDPELVGDTEIQARFEREANLAARLEHPNIVAVQDHGAEGQVLWIAMQYVPGAETASLGVIDPKRALRIITDTAEAHHNSVLHRDAIPANILLAHGQPGQPDQVLLEDFRIARLHDDAQQLVRNGSFTATLAFIRHRTAARLCGRPVARADATALPIRDASICTRASVAVSSTAILTP